MYHRGLGTKQALSEGQMGWYKSHAEAALKPDISGWLWFEREEIALVSGVCGPYVGEMLLFHYVRRDCIKHRRSQSQLDS